MELVIPIAKLKRILPFLAILSVLVSPMASAGEKGKYAAGHRSVCLVHDEIAFDPKEGVALQFLVDIGYLPGYIGELAYSLRTPKSVDPIKGSSRLLLNQVWYPVSRKDRKHFDNTTHTDFFTNNATQEELAYYLSAILNLGGLMESGSGYYPNEPANYGPLLASDSEVAEFVVNGEAGSLEGAPVASKGGPFPLVILDSPAIHEHYLVAEQLARNGYIVIAPVHPNDQFYDGVVNIGDPTVDGLPVGGIPYGLNCSTEQIDAAKPVNGIIDFNMNLNNVWQKDNGIYLGTLGINSTLEDTLFYRAADIGILISRADELFIEADVVDNNRVGLIGYSLGGNAVQNAVSDDVSLADPSQLPAIAREGLDRVDATVSWAGHNRFASSSSRSTQMLKPSLALQGRQDLVVNQNSGTYGLASLEEPNPVMLDNYQNRYAPGVPAMRVLIDRFNHSDFRSSEPFNACVEHGGSDQLVPPACIAARPVDERYGLVDDPAGGITIGGVYEGRALEEKLAITSYFTKTWLDLYVKDELCSDNHIMEVDGKKITPSFNNVVRLTSDLFDPSSLTIEYRDFDADTKVLKHSKKSEKSSKRKKSGKSDKSGKSNRSKGKDNQSSSCRRS